MREVRALGLREYVLAAIFAGGAIAAQRAPARALEDVRLPARVRTAENPEGLEQLVNSTYKIKSTIIFEGRMYSNEDNSLLGVGQGRKVAYASCFGVYKDEEKREVYFLTAEHATMDPDFLDIDLRAEGLVREEKRQVSQDIEIIVYEDGEERTLAHLEEVKGSTDDDLSLLVARDVDVDKFEVYSLISKVPARLGDKVYSVGFPHKGSTSFGRTLHTGIISCSKGGNWDGLNKWLITESVLDFGMSGGPSAIVRDGRLYLIGVNSIQIGSEDLRNSYGIAKNILRFLQDSELRGRLVDKKFY